jgi:hypothetical protein
VPRVELGILRSLPVDDSSGNGLVLRGQRNDWQLQFRYL